MLKASCMILIVYLAIYIKPLWRAERMHKLLMESSIPQKESLNMLNASLGSALTTVLPRKRNKAERVHK